MSQPAWDNCDGVQEKLTCHSIFFSPLYQTWELEMFDLKLGLCKARATRTYQYTPAPFTSLVGWSYISDISYDAHRGETSLNLSTGEGPGVQLLFKAHSSVWCNTEATNVIELRL